MVQSSYILGENSRPRRKKTLSLGALLSSDPRVSRVWEYTNVSNRFVPDFLVEIEQGARLTGQWLELWAGGIKRSFFTNLLDEKKATTLNQYKFHKP